MSGFEASGATARERLESVRTQVSRSEVVGALLVALQLAVWRYPAAEPTQLVRASLGRPTLLVVALAERLSELAWLLLGPLALAVPAVVAWILLDPPGASLRPHALRLAGLGVGASLLLEAAGGGDSPWLSGGLLGRAAVALFVQLFVSESWGAGFAAVLGAAALAWASGVAAFAARRGPDLRRSARWLASRAMPAAEGTALVARRGIAGAVELLERRQAIAAPSPAERTTSPVLAATPSGTAIETGGAQGDAA